ncbi:hypothetical protein [Oligoflexus tunisiensis]|uniref:hypothetical protein n=1 Tax=Oligoflexus tunisiensis TaxID=708132 RepID=UPI00114CE534|nr:hypothetical protein [Oligoflexus tunisiensis]
MQKKVIVALVVILGVIGYAVSRSEKDSSVSLDDSTAEVKPHEKPNRAATVSETSAPTPVDQSAPVGEEQVSAPVKALETQPSVASEDNSSEAQSENPESLVDTAREDKLNELLIQKGSDVDKYVEVQSIVCKGKVCTIEASAKDSPALFQTAVAQLIQQNPWLGNKMDLQPQQDDPGVAKFTIYRE